MRRKTMCLISIGGVLTIFGLAVSIGNMLTTSAGPTGAIGLGILGFSSFVIGFWLLTTQYRYHRQWSYIVPLAESYDEISLDKLSREFGLPIRKVRKIILTAISEGELQGTLRDDSYIRTAGIPGISSSAERTVVEREVKGTRRVPETCFKCGANIKPDSVTWIGADRVECPHCGASLKVTAEHE